MRFISFFLFIILLLSSCKPANVLYKNALPNEDEINEAYEQRLRNNKNRDSTLKNGREGPICEENKTSSDCDEICKKIYPNPLKVLQDCRKLSITQIEYLEVVHEALKVLTTKKLEEVNPLDFDIYLNVDIKAFDNMIRKSDLAVGKYTGLLRWILHNAEIQEIFEIIDTEYDSLEIILKKIRDPRDRGLTKELKPEEGLKLTIAPGESVMEYVILNENNKEEFNKEALTWLENYILTKNKTCRSTPTANDCFSSFCTLGASMNEETRSIWLYPPGSNAKDYENSFEDYIKSVVDSNSLDNVNDWYTDLCRANP